MAVAVRRIEVDLFERRSAVPGELSRRRVDVRYTRLAVGDYALGDGIRVERKTVRDLHDSVLSGRFWRQLDRLRADSRAPVLVVEGTALVGALGQARVRGVLLAASDLGCIIVRTTDPADTADWLVALLRRGVTPNVVRVRPPYSRPYPRLSASEAMLAAVPGISPHTAARLIERFGCVASVVAASSRELVEVPGIGVKRAQGSTTPPSPHSCEARVARYRASAVETCPREERASPARARQNRGTWEGILSAASSRI